jgi:hypothetical protein
MEFAAASREVLGRGLPDQLLVPSTAATPTDAASDPSSQVCMPTDVATDPSSMNRLDGFRDSVTQRLHRPSKTREPSLPLGLQRPLFLCDVDLLECEFGAGRVVGGRSPS